MYNPFQKQKELLLARIFIINIYSILLIKKVQHILFYYFKKCNYYITTKESHLQIFKSKLQSVLIKLIIIEPMTIF